MKKNTFFFTALLLLSLSLNAQMYRIHNQKFGNHFLNNETGSMQSSPIRDGWWSAQWTLVPISPEKPEVFVLVNHWTGCALEAKNNLLECSEYKDNATKMQQWTLVSKDAIGFGSLMNVGTSMYLNEESNQKLVLQKESEISTAKWKFRIIDEWEVVSEEKTIQAPSITENLETAAETELVSNPVELNQAQINEFVNSHNMVRRAVGMPDVKWNREIANYAREWAVNLVNKQECELAHRQENTYGENIFQGTEITLTKPSVAVESWAAEKKDYKGGTIDANLVAGHYTQIIWRKTTEIGCGLAVCPAKNYVIAVCNYNPPGNYEGESPFDK